MKRIDEYVNSVYAHIDSKEANELKEEMRSHLLEAVAELKAEGKTEEQAVAIALKRFGDKRQITRGLFSLFRTQNKVVKNLFIISLVSLVIGIGFYIFLFIRDKSIATENSTIHSTVQSAIDHLGDQEPTESEKNAIVSTLKEATDGKVENFILYKKSEGSPEVFEESSFPAIYSSMEKVMKFGETNTWDMGVENKNWYAEIGYKDNPSYGTLYAFPMSLLMVFLILGAIGLLLKYYWHHKTVHILLKD